MAIRRQWLPRTNELALCHRFSWPSWFSLRLLIGLRASLFEGARHDKKSPTLANLLGENAGLVTALRWVHAKSDSRFLRMLQTEAQGPPSSQCPRTEFSAAELPLASGPVASAVALLPSFLTAVVASAYIVSAKTDTALPCCLESADTRGGRSALSRLGSRNARAFMISERWSPPAGWPFGSRMSGGGNLLASTHRSIVRVDFPP